MSSIALRTTRFIGSLTRRQEQELFDRDEEVFAIINLKIR